jgi:aspartate/glutamate racemase
LDGLEILTPADADRAVVHRVIFEELTRGVISDTSRQEYLRAVRLSLGLEPLPAPATPPRRRS